MLIYQNAEGVHGQSKLKGSKCWRGTWPE